MNALHSDSDFSIYEETLHCCNQKGQKYDLIWLFFSWRKPLSADKDKNCDIRKASNKKEGCDIYF